MGLACSKNHQNRQFEINKKEKNEIRSVKAQLNSLSKYNEQSPSEKNDNVKRAVKPQLILYSMKKPSEISSNRQGLFREEFLTLLMQPELYQELQAKLANEQQNTKESIQIVLNIFLYCNFKGENIKNCFNLLNTDNDYKEDLKLIGVYRDSALKYHKSDSCLLCLSNNIECYSLKCQHIFCKGCWNQMIEIQLSNYIPIVKCLQYQCVERLPHKFLEQNQSYKEILVKRMLDNDKDFTWCPGFQCQNIYKQEQFSDKQKCHCGLEFCPNCKTEIHYPITCDIYKEITQFKESKQCWTSLDIATCPNCKRCIQKIEGCMQISCVCGNDFCIKCSQPWNQQHGSDYYNCPFTSYNKNPSQILHETSQKETLIEKNIFELEYYQKLLNQKKGDEQTHILKRGLINLIKFKKFEKIVLYYKYYLIENFGNNELDHNYEQYSLEITNYFRIMINQLSGVILDESKIVQNQMIEFDIFQNLLFQMEQNLQTQKKGFKKFIKKNQKKIKKNKL